MRKLTFATMALLTALVCFAPAAVITAGPGPSFFITDGNTSISDIQITDTRIITGGLTVTLFSLTHTWVGDLIATLTHVPSATTQTLFNRVGRLGSTTGDSSNLAGDYAFSNASGGFDFWSTAAGLDGDSVIPGRRYYPTGADSAAVLNLSNFFNGLSAAGTWRLTISDNVVIDEGSLQGWEIAMNVADDGGNGGNGGSGGNQVPEPSMALPLLGLLAGGLALRRKVQAAR